MKDILAFDAAAPDNASDLGPALDLLRIAQVTDDYKELVRSLAGPLHRNVQQVFPGHLALIYLTTDVRRRQVWNACLSAVQLGKDTSNISNDPADLRRAFLTSKTNDLLTDAFGGPAPGFASLLAKLGPVACEAEVYEHLRKLAMSGVKLRRDLLREDRLTARLIRRLSTLPDAFRKISFAREIRDDVDVDRFVELLRTVENGNIENKEVLIEGIRKAVQHGGDVAEAVRQVYIRLPFPAPAIPEGNRIRHLHNGLAMEAAGRRFRCCVGDLVPQAVRGARQFYEWSGEKPAIVSLRNTRGRWQIDEVKLRRNRDPSDELLAQIKTDFAQVGVDHSPAFSELLERFLLSSAFGPEPDEMTQEEALVDLNYMFGTPEQA